MKYFWMILFFVPLFPSNSNAKSCIRAYKQYYFSHMSETRIQSVVGKVKIAASLNEWRKYVRQGKHGVSTEELLTRFLATYPEYRHQVDARTIGNVLFVFVQAGLLCIDQNQKVIPLYGVPDVLKEFHDLLDTYLQTLPRWQEGTSGEVFEAIEDLTREYHQILLSSNTDTSRAKLLQLEVENIEKLRNRVSRDLQHHFEKYYFLRATLLDEGHPVFAFYDQLLDASKKLDSLMLDLKRTKGLLLQQEYPASIAFMQAQLHLQRVRNHPLPNWRACRNYFAKSIAKKFTSITCVACADTFPGKDSVGCDTCAVHLCKNCFKQYFRSAFRDRAFPIQCPDGSCAGRLAFGEEDLIEFSNLELQVWKEGVLRNLIRQQGSLTECQTPDCRGFVGVDRSECEYCGSRNFCKRCMQLCGVSDQRHRRMTREEEENYRVLLRKGELKRCPSCKVLIEKNEGCMHMTCSNCNHEFHWDTGKDWHTLRSSYGPMYRSELIDSDIYCDPNSEESKVSTR